MNRPADPMDSTDAKDVDHGTFMRLFSEHHHKIYAFIRSLVLHRTDADEVFQETSVVLWRAFPEFRADGSFPHWACGVALNQVRKYRRNHQKDPLIFSDELLKILARDKVAAESRAEARRDALTHCMKKLRDVDRQLVQRCYGGGESFRTVAEQLSKPVNTVYHALSRIRRKLHDCIDRRTRLETEA